MPDLEAWQARQAIEDPDPMLSSLQKRSVFNQVSVQQFAEAPDYT